MTDDPLNARRDDAGTLARLLDGTLDPARFDHRDHLGVGFEILKRHEFFEAAHLFADALRTLATRAGVPDKFNATVTLAYLSLIGERMQKGVYTDASDFLRANADMFDKDVLEPWFTRDRLNAAASRYVPLLPDRTGIV